MKNLSAPGIYTDGGGLMLRVHPSGGKNWVLRLTVDGKRRNFGLGGYPDVSLKAAREQAEGMRQLARDGVDPAVHIEAQRIKKASIPTFGQAAETVIELRAPTWTSRRHATQWRESLRLHALPVLGKKPVDAIDTADALSVLMPIWNAKPETAGRVPAAHGDDLRLRGRGGLAHGQPVQWRAQGRATPAEHDRSNTIRPYRMPKSATRSARSATPRDATP